MPLVLLHCTTRGIDHCGLQLLVLVQTNTSSASLQLIYMFCCVSLFPSLILDGGASSQHAAVDRHALATPAAPAALQTRPNAKCHIER
jgi:hypothetical protein